MVSLIFVIFVVGALLVRRRRRDKGSASNLATQNGGGMFVNPAYQGTESRTEFERRGRGMGVTTEYDQLSHDRGASLGPEAEDPGYLEPSWDGAGQGPPRMLSSDGAVAHLPDHDIRPKKLGPEGRTQHVFSNTVYDANNGTSQDLTNPEYAETEGYSAISAIPDYAQCLRADDGYEQPMHDSSVTYAQPGDARGSIGEDIYQVSKRMKANV